MKKNKRDEDEDKGRKRKCTVKIVTRDET